MYFNGKTATYSAQGALYSFDFITGTYDLEFAYNGVQVAPNVPRNLVECNGYLFFRGISVYGLVVLLDIPNNFNMTIVAPPGDSAYGANLIRDSRGHNASLISSINEFLFCHDNKVFFELGSAIEVAYNGASTPPDYQPGYFDTVTGEYHQISRSLIRGTASGNANANRPLTRDYIAFKDSLYFAASTTALGTELYRWNSTTGTVLVSDYNPGAGSGINASNGSLISKTVHNGALYFYCSSDSGIHKICRTFDGINIEEYSTVTSSITSILSF